MKIKMIVLILACVLLACFALGAADVVRLADAATGEENANIKDRLIGVFITTEPLRLFEAEGYLNNNADKILSGEEISKKASAVYQGKLFATLIEKPYTGEETGQTFTTREYAFEGVVGVGYFAALYTDDVSTYHGSSGDEAISDGHIAVNSTDAGDSISLEGTIYVSTVGGPTMFYHNPVYQTARGEVYAMNGQGMSYGGDITAGMSGSHELKEEYSVTAEDQTTTVGSYIKVTVCFMDEPTGVTVIQLDNESKVLCREECAPGKLPETLAVEAGAEYVIVETRAKGTTSRDLYQPGDESLYAFYCRDDGICVKQYCRIEWGD